MIFKRTKSHYSIEKRRVNAKTTYFTNAPPRGCYGKYFGRA